MANRNNYPRRKFIKKTSLLAGAAIAGFNIIGKASPAVDNIVGHGNFRYRVNKAWGNLDPAKTPVLDCHEMVNDSKGRLVMITDEVKNDPPGWGVIAMFEQENALPGAERHPPVVDRDR